MLAENYFESMLDVGLEPTTSLQLKSQNNYSSKMSLRKYHFLPDKFNLIPFKLSIHKDVIFRLFEVFLQEMGASHLSLSLTSTDGLKS